MVRINSAAPKPTNPQTPAAQGRQPLALAPNLPARNLRLTALLAGGTTLLATQDVLAGIKETHAVSASTAAWAIGAVLYSGDLARFAVEGSRMIRGQAPISPYPENRLWQVVNDLSGAYNHAISGVRGFTYIPTMVAAAALSSEVNCLPAIVATALSVLAFNEKIITTQKQLVEAQMREGRTLTPQATHDLERTGSGILATHPRPINESDYVEPNTKLAPTRRTQRKLSRSGAFLGFLSAIPRLFRLMGLRWGIEGAGKVLGDYWTNLYHNKPSPIRAEAIKLSEVLMGGFIQSYADMNGATLSSDLNLLDTIPAGKPVVGVMWPHAETIMFRWDRHRTARYLAEGGNYGSNPIVRAIGLATTLNAIGLHTVTRDHKSSKEEMTQLYKTMAKESAEFGTQHIIFPQSGRGPRTYDRSGRLDTPGIYTAVQSKVDQYPERYYNLNGTLDAAFTAAQEYGEAYLPILIHRFTDNEGRPSTSVQHKDGKGKLAVFAGQNMQGVTAHLFCPEVIKITPDMDRKTVEEQIIKTIRKHSKIDDYLEMFVDSLSPNYEETRLDERKKNFYEKTTITEAHYRADGEKNETRPETNLGQRFKELATKDMRWYILCDRMRAVHPLLRESEIPRFINLINQTPMESSWTTAHTSFLVEVSKMVKTYEYSSEKQILKDLKREAAKAAKLKSKKPSNHSESTSASL